MYLSSDCPHIGYAEREKKASPSPSKGGDVRVEGDSICPVRKLKHTVNKVPSPAGLAAPKHNNICPFFHYSPRLDGTTRRASLAGTKQSILSFTPRPKVADFSNV
jgi:hypothetical protein